MRLRMLAAIGMVAAAVLVAAAPAGAFVLQAKPGPLSATNGIVLGPDGNFWIAEQFADSVVRMRPDGTVLNHYPLGLGAAPTTVTTGPGGRVWVAATGADKLVWIDATAATPATHDVSTAGVSACGPVALAAGGDGRLYFSLPFDGVCVTGSSLASVADDGTGAITTVPNRGLVFDLVVAQGKLFAPDFDGGVVRRLALGAALAEEAQITAPPGAQPQGVTADGAGNIWFTEFGSGSVGRFAAAAPNATAATQITPIGGALAQPVGIVAGADGAMYVAGSGSANVVRISADGTRFAFFPVAGAKPFRIVNGIDGDLWFTDGLQARVLRLISGAPRTTLVGAAAASATTAAVLASVNPRGNDTAVFFDFGTTVNYGSATTPIGVAAGLDPVSVPNALTGLAPATTYHVRARATNVDGTTVSPDTTFTTPAAPPGTGGPGSGLPRLKATTAFGYTRSASSLTLRRIGLAKLAGGETATIRCSASRRCPFKVRIFKRLKKGSRAFGKALLKARRLPIGTTISVRVTKAGSVGTSAVLKVRRRKAPQITRLCLVPGATSPTKCT